MSFSILSTFEGIFGISETWVVNTLIKAQHVGEVLVADAKLVWGWVAAHANEITSDANLLASTVTTLYVAAGKPVPSSLTTAIQGMNEAVAALNGAVNAAATPNANTVSVLVGAYTAAKNAEAAHSVASGAAVSSAS